MAVALSEGIADKSLRAIAEASETSHRMLIHHFGSKEGLLVAVIHEAEARQRKLFEDLSIGLEGHGAESWLIFWKRLRSPKLAPQERLFFEVYSQALQGRSWAKPLLKGIVESWTRPLAAGLTAQGVEETTSRAVARLSVAVTRGLLLDVLATGQKQEVDRSMELFAKMLLAFLQLPG